VFRKKGKCWEVVSCGRSAFRLRNTLGARYLDYLLHEPNEPICAFDLEVEVQPEKGKARVRDSFPPESDAQALREYRKELRQLQMETAQAAWKQERVALLEGEMEALKSSLKGVGAADTGERAFDQLFAKINCTLAQFGQEQVDAPPAHPQFPDLAPTNLVITNASEEKRSAPAN